VNLLQNQKQEIHHKSRITCGLWLTNIYQI